MKQVRLIKNPTQSEINKNLEEIQNDQHEVLKIEYFTGQYQYSSTMCIITYDMRVKTSSGFIS